jgi:hypothetical protein
MARAGVADAVAERILGHQVGGIVHRTYNRWEYIEEMDGAAPSLRA